MRASLLLFALSACATTAPPTLMNSGPEWMRTGQDVPDLAPTHVVSPMGFTEDGIRYIWPQRNARKSNNFWIRWSTGSGYVLNRRVSWSWSGLTSIDRRFKESSLDLMLKCLVTGVRIKSAAVCSKRFWLF